MERTRRAVIRTAVAAGVVGLAGCTARFAGSTDTGSPTDTEAPADDPSDDTPISTPTETPPVTRTVPIGTGAKTETGPQVTEATLSTVGSSCGSDPSAEIAKTVSGIEATGTIVAPTPCHVAELVEFEDDGAVARFVIDVEDDPEKTACVQCIGEVSFELAATFDGEFDAVVLDVRGAEPEEFRKELV